MEYKLLGSGQQARVQIEVHFVIDTCAIWYICNIQSNASSVKGQQGRVQIEVHPGTCTCDRGYMLGSLFYTYRARVHLKAYCKLCRVHANLSGVIWKRGDVGGTVYPVQTWANMGEKCILLCVQSKDGERGSPLSGMVLMGSRQLTKWLPAGAASSAADGRRDQNGWYSVDFEGLFWPNPARLPGDVPDRPRLFQMDCGQYSSLAFPGSLASLRCRLASDSCFFHFNNQHPPPPPPCLATTQESWCTHCQLVWEGEILLSISNIISCEQKSCKKCQICTRKHISMKESTLSMFNDGRASPGSANTIWERRMLQYKRFALSPLTLKAAENFAKWEGAIGQQEAVGSIWLRLNGQYGSRVTQVSTLLNCEHCLMCSLCTLLT